jgi:excisionase family DNA binding protein
MSSDFERLLKPREFCGIVGISYRTFKRWVSEGKIRVVRTPTGRIRVPYGEVMKIISGVEEGAGLKPRQELIEELTRVVSSFAEKLYPCSPDKKKRLVEGFKKLLEEVEKSE